MVLCFFIGFLQQYNKILTIYNYKIPLRSPYFPFHSIFFLMNIFFLKSIKIFGEMDFCL